MIYEMHICARKNTLIRCLAFQNHVSAASHDGSRMTHVKCRLMKAIRGSRS